MLNGPTCIISVQIKRKAVENKLNLLLSCARLTPKHLSIHSVYLKSSNTMFMGVLKKPLSSLSVRWCCWRSYI